MLSIQNVIREHRNGNNSFLIPTPGLDIPLTSSIVPVRGVGAPTFTRATTAYQQDFEKMNAVLSGEARFVGARRVANLVTTSSALIAVAGNNTMTLAAGTYVFSMGAGTGTATFSGTSGATGTLAANATSRTASTLVLNAGTLIVTASVANLVDIQVENVTGQANQNPSEYVSLGVLAVPYYGAGVDGVRYFDTYNGNTVAANVVTLASGAKIASTILQGYLPESASTNLLTFSNDITNAAWVKTTLTTALTSVGPDGLANSATRCTAAGANSTALQTITAAAADRTYSVWVKRITGIGNFDITQNGGTAWTTQTLVAGWNQVQLNASILNASVGFRIVTSGDAFDIWCNQFEAGVVPNPPASTPIPTTTVAVTRNTDILTYATTGNIGASGTIIAEILHTPINNPVAYQRIVSSYPGASIMFALDGVTHKPALYDGLAWADAALPFTPSNNMQKMAVGWSGSSAGFTLNGSAVSNVAFTGPASFGANIAIGNDVNGAVGAFGEPLRNVRIWATKLPDNLLTAITE